MKKKLLGFIHTHHHHLGEPAPSPTSLHVCPSAGRVSGQLLTPRKGGHRGAGLSDMSQSVSRMRQASCSRPS